MDTRTAAWITSWGIWLLVHPEAFAQQRIPSDLPVELVQRAESLLAGLRDADDAIAASSSLTFDLFVPAVSHAPMWGSFTCACRATSLNHVRALSIELSYEGIPKFISPGSPGQRVVYDEEGRMSASRPVFVGAIARGDGILRLVRDEVLLISSDGKPTLAGHPRVGWRDTPTGAVGMWEYEYFLLGVGRGLGRRADGLTGVANASDGQLSLLVDGTFLGGARGEWEFLVDAEGPAPLVRRSTFRPEGSTSPLLVAESTGTCQTTSFNVGSAGRITLFLDGGREVWTLRVATRSCGADADADLLAEVKSVVKPVEDGEVNIVDMTAGHPTLLPDRAVARDGR